MSRAADLRALEGALGEVMTVGELAPALTILEGLTGAFLTGFFRFPRHRVGVLGELFLRLAEPPPGNLWRQLLSEPSVVSVIVPPPASSPAEAQLAADGIHSLLVVRFNSGRIGERGSAGLALARRAPETLFEARDVASLQKLLPAFATAFVRIQRFEAMSGNNLGLMALIEDRLDACVALASAKGEILWASQSARTALGDHGAALLEERLRQALRELTQTPTTATANQFVLKLGKTQLFGNMSFVRESPQASIHYVAVELHGHGVEAAADSFRLTRAEREVHGLLLEDLGYSDIAKARNVSIETVRSVVKSIYRKLGVSSRVELLVKYKPGAR